MRCSTSCAVRFRAISQSKNKIMGRIANIKVPKGCNEIYVDIEDDKVIVSYGSRLNDMEFYCSLTDEVETLPGIGDFCIMWDEKRRMEAICANYDFSPAAL